MKIPVEMPRLKGFRFPREISGIAAALGSLNLYGNHLRCRLIIVHHLSDAVDTCFQP